MAAWTQWAHFMNNILWCGYWMGTLSTEVIPYSVECLNIFILYFNVFCLQQRDSLERAHSNIQT